MKSIRLLACFLALVVGFYGAGVALAYWNDTSVCFVPPHVVSDEERISNVVEWIGVLSKDYPDYRSLDRDHCCTVLKERSAGDYSVTFTTIASLRWTKLVEAKVGLAPPRTLIFRTDQCGNVVTS